MIEKTAQNETHANCTDAKLIESVVVASGQPVNRLTAAHIDAVIVKEAFHVFPDSTVTVCMLTLRNGAKVLGHNYGSIDPSQQDWATGRREARAIAVEKAWELEGYLLRQNLASHVNLNG